MNKLITSSIIAALSLAAGTPALAQMTAQTKVDNSTSVKDGVATTKRTVTHTMKRKTHRPKKILGVKIGHKTVTHKTVHTTSSSTNGDASTTVKTSN